MPRFMFRDEVDEFYARIRRAAILEKAAAAYYANTDSGAPQFDELGPGVQEEWLRKVTGRE